MGNLAFWDFVEETDKNFTKKIPGGKNLTAIDAYYQIKRATELWGPYGLSWGVECGTDKFEFITTPVGGIAVYTARMYFPANLGIDHAQYRNMWDGEFGFIPIHSSLQFYGKRSNGTDFIDDDCVKKVSTNALSKGLSKLGFNADVFLGAFDEDKYIRNKKSETKTEIGEIGPPKTTRNLMSDTQKRELNNICSKYNVTKSFIASKYSITQNTTEEEAKNIIPNIRRDLAAEKNVRDVMGA